jgi:ferredoxin
MSVSRVGTTSARDSVAAMKVIVDTAPDVFQIGDDGSLKVLNETPPETRRDAVQKAERECPTSAITIEG